MKIMLLIFTWLTNTMEKDWLAKQNISLKTHKQITSTHGFIPCTSTITNDFQNPAYSLSFLVFHLIFREVMLPIPMIQRVTLQKPCSMNIISVQAVARLNWQVQQNTSTTTKKSGFLL